MRLWYTAGFNAVRSRLNGIQLRLKRTSTPMQQALEAIRDWVQDNIRGEGQKAGGWPPLALSTVRRKERGGWPRAMLVRTGQLRDDWRVRVTGSQGFLTAGAPYAVFHQRGTRFMPRRRILPTSREAEKLIQPIFGKHVRVAIRG